MLHWLKIRQFDTPAAEKKVANRKVLFKLGNKFTKLKLSNPWTDSEVWETAHYTRAYTATLTDPGTRVRVSSTPGKSSHCAGSLWHTCISTVTRTRQISRQLVQRRQKLLKCASVARHQWCQTDLFLQYLLIKQPHNQLTWFSIK